METQLVPQGFDFSKIRILTKNGRYVTEDFATDRMLIHTAPNGWRTAFTNEMFDRLLAVAFAQAVNVPVEAVVVERWYDFADPRMLVWHCCWCRIPSSPP